MKQQSKFSLNWLMSLFKLQMKQLLFLITLEATMGRCVNRIMCKADN